MLNSYPRHQFQLATNNADDGGDEGVVDGIDGYNPFYGIIVVCVSIFLFCVLTAASFNVWKALTIAALAALLLGVAGCFAPKGCLRRPRPTTGRGANENANANASVSAGAAELVVTVRATTTGPTWPGYACAQVLNAPPAFAFRCPPLKADDGRSEQAEAAAAASSSVVCSVCLEDVRGGEMVRQVPACRHVFHVGCIDMWLHAHGTCPMCRCVVVSPPFKAVATSRDAAEAPESSADDDDELPPV